MLRAFACWLSPRTVLASYNGRCYDAPLRKTRYRLARLPDPLGELRHVDLLFPSRRRWRGRWENCRLATIEREALGVVREADLPGSQAPAAWLQYLRGRSEEHTSELQSLMRTSYAVFCLTTKNIPTKHNHNARHDVTNLRRFKRD